MSSMRGRRDPQTGRVLGFQSEAQRHNFMIGRARFCNGPNRLMPTCTAMTRSGEPCKAARMRGRSTCFRHGGSPGAKRMRLAAAYLSGDSDRIQRAEMRLECQSAFKFWTPIPRLRGSILGSDSLLMQFERCLALRLRENQPPCSKHSSAPAWCRVVLLWRVRTTKEIRPLLRSGRPEALVCVHHAEPFPGVSIAGIGDA
jgi:hypothetical protein